MAKSKSIIDRILQFNQGRSPKLLRIKYQAMRKDAFAWFRGTGHIFYEDWPQQSAANLAPHVWSCGDLHLENFGSYKGDNRLIYFDINDFDEALLAPATWDVTRFLASVLLLAHTLKLQRHQASLLCDSYLEAYTAALAKGQSRTVERETATGLVKELLVGLTRRRRADFLSQRTETRPNKQRRILIDPSRTFPTTKEEWSRLKEMVRHWALGQPKPEFFTLLDAAHRIAGTGSLGVERFVLLVEGKGSPGGNYLLDFKQELSPCGLPYTRVRQPKWKSEAERVVAVQERFQGTPPALLSAVHFEDKAFVLRELQPIQDRVRFDTHQSQFTHLLKLLKTMGEITAWDQLRGSGRQNSAIADHLIKWAGRRDWQGVVLDLAQDSAGRAHEYFSVFSKATSRQLHLK